MAGTQAASRSGGRRRSLLPAAAALTIFAASTLVDVIAASHASAASTELYSWGNNVDGQLGNGTTTNSSTPLKVSLPAGVTATAAAAGGDHSLAVGSDGKLYAWGVNSNGELGDGTTTASSTPVVVSLPGGVTATAVAAGAAHSVALGSDGHVYDWGYNGFGQLGNGTTTDSSTPIQVTLPGGVSPIAVAAGQYMTETLASNGNVYAWGDGAMGELGNGKVTNQKSPIQVNVAGVSAIAAGGYHSLVISAGSVFAYGYGGLGQLGDGALTNASTRVKVNLPTGVTPVAVSAGLYHSMAIGNNGKLYAWGNNATGELGNGTLVNTSTPALVSMPAGVTPTSITDAADSSYAIGSDGNLYAWGYNGLDELGNGTSTDSSTPIQVGLTPVAKPPNAVASGSSADHAFAIAPPTPAPTTTTLSTSPSSVTYGQTVTIKAALSRSDGGGTVSFANGSNTITGCAAVAPSLVGGSYQAVCPTSFAAGTYPLSATYSGDTLYATSTSTVLDLTVNPAPLVVTASSASATYGAGPPAITPSYSGFVNGDDSTALTTPPTCSTTATTSSPVGSYPTSCSGASDPNYAITYQGGTLTVNSAPLTVTASSSSMNYGGAVPAITPSYSGFVNGDSASSLTTAPTCSTTATSSSPVGSYGSSCSGAVDPNYQFSYAAGTVAVDASPLVITASSGSVTYGNGPPAITPSYSGFLNGDTPSSLMTKPTCTTAVTASTAVGSYPSSCSGAVDPNYVISYGNGTISVTPAPLTITASSGMTPYGTAPPAVAPTVTGLQNGEAVSVLGGGLACSSAATASSPVGTYATTCSGAVDPNYTITYVAGTTTVIPAPITITATSGTMTYGGAVPVVSPSVSGLQNGENISVLGAGLACTTTASPTEPVGTYPTSCSGASDANYTVSYVSGTVSITPASLAITASSNTMTYGDPAPALTPIVSGLQNGETPAVLGAALLCTTGAGPSSPVATYASDCGGAVDANYTITYFPGTVTVQPATLMITASSATVAYGVAPPTITPAYSGFVNGDDATALTTPPACSTTATSSSPVGSYPTSCSGAVDPNYSISYLGGAVHVAAVTVVVTASSGSMTYGGSVPTVTPSYSGFVNGDTAASLTTAPTCTTSASSSSPVGPYDTSCSGAVDPNYTFSYQSGTVQVNPAPLTVAAGSASMTYGGATPAIVPSYSGFVNGDTAAALSTPPTCSTTASSSSPVGTYSSTCSGAVGSNYTISYVPGAVVVGSATLVVSASSGSMTYGGSAPAITPTYSGFVNGDSPASLTTPPTCSTAATPASHVGSVPATCSGAVDPNYSIVYVAGSVTVGPAPLSVTASSGSMTYGGSTPTVTPSYDGFVNGDSAASLTTAPTCSSAAAGSSPVGVYPSSCSGAVDADYSITYVAGSVQVNPATLSVTASSALTSYGDPVPAVTAAYSGFVGADSPSSLTTAPTCTTTATSASPVGSYPSSCSGAVDANYAISYLDGSVQVGPAPLTVTASSASITYGGAAPLITASYSGFVNGDDATSLSTAPTCSTAVTSVSAVGTYSSSCSGAADANYQMTYVDGSVEVGPASITVTASSGSMVYGGSVPAVTAGVDGLQNGETAAVLGGGLTCSTTATSASPVGSYPSSCSGASDPNYTVTYVSGSTAVGPAALSISASSTSMTYGGSVPAVSASYSGFVNGDIPAALTSPPTCSTTATSSSQVGTYPSSCSGASDPNYTISYVGGTVQVTTAPLVIAASSPSMTYGAAVPAITPSYSGFVNGDNAGSLTTLPTCSTGATSTSPVGGYPSSCTGASDPDYSITYVPGVTEVGSAALVVRASSGTMTYGGGVPAITPTYSGFVNGDNAGSLTHGAVCSTTASSSKAVGNYTSSCSGATDPNYTITYVTGIVTIGPAPLTISASSGTMTYGGTAPAIAATFTGFVNGEGPSVLGNGLTCSTAATATSPVGSYTSSCAGAVDPNYAISYVPGAVTVGPATLTVTANNVTKAFGAAVPALSATLTGFVNGQTLSTSGVTGQALCTTTATATSPGGTYPITCSLGTLAAANYTFSFVSGTLTVTFSQRTVCDYFGPLVVSGGQSVLIPPGCFVAGAVSVQTGSSLDAEGAIVIGSVSFNSGVVLRFCSTTVIGQVYATLATNPVVMGDGTSSCLGDTVGGFITLTGNTAGVSLQKADMLAAVSITTNSGGVTVKNCAAIALVGVKGNTGGTTVVSNSILGALTVTGNAAPVVDRPNTVIGFAQLQ
jgi:alpha-tubulin suppressor-like RCC1 family protein